MLDEDQKAIVVKRLNIPCAVRIDNRLMIDAIYALESYYHSPEERRSKEFADAISNLGTNYIKFIDVLVMSDGTIKVAPEQRSTDAYWSPIGQLRKDLLEDE